jgi:uncharacterized protein YndB with AHSA1/START domain
MNQILRDPATVPSEHLGTVGKLADGKSFVKFERDLNHSIDKVWAAITDPAQRDCWFPGFTLDLTLGGGFEIWFGGDCDGPAHMEGTVIELDPPNLLQCGSMRYELNATEHGCHLTFTDVVQYSPSQLTPKILNSILGGWHRHTDMLEEHLNGAKVDQLVPELDYANTSVPGRD